MQQEKEITGVSEEKSLVIILVAFFVMIAIYGLIWYWGYTTGKNSSMKRQVHYEQQGIVS